jgi:tripartite-type tricarboxylate transporter receptor subunit TctC
MNLRRRAFLQSTGSAAALLATSRPSFAQTYPSRPLRLIVGFAPGGTADTVARIIASSLSHRLGQRVIVENRSGAGSHVATRAVLEAPLDGYTLLLTGSSTIVNALLQERHHSAILQELVPVAGLTASAFVILANSSVSERTLDDLIAFAKANPGKLRMGSYGVGTQSHVAARLFSQRAASIRCTFPIGAARRWSGICSVGIFRSASIRCRVRCLTSIPTRCVHLQ